MESRREKLEIIRLVELSGRPVRLILAKLGISGNLSAGTTERVVAGGRRLAARGSVERGWGAQNVSNGAPEPAPARTGGLSPTARFCLRGLGLPPAEGRDLIASPAAPDQGRRCGKKDHRT
jgi:hypothetical protein